MAEADNEEQRHSRAFSPVLITDPDERADREARNGLQQFDVAVQLIDDWLHPDRKPFRLRPSMIQQLHRAALDGISAFAGNWRPAGVSIEGSQHIPPGAHLVAEHVEEMCDYVNEHWDSQTALHLAAYVMWRLNWIHPFDDGNGRTSRALSYVILCIKLGYQLPGVNTIPEQIVRNRRPYFRAIDAADEACRHGRIDVDELAHVIQGLLANQLIGIYRDATGRDVRSAEKG